jgi:hypothetical protein
MKGMTCAKLMLEWTEEVCLLGSTKTHFDNSTTPLLHLCRAMQTERFPEA